MARRERLAFEQRAVAAAVPVGADRLEMDRLSPSRRDSEMASPAAGWPAEVSRTCVVRRPVLADIDLPLVLLKPLARAFRRV
jgi:hypothetical protein